MARAASRVRRDPRRHLHRTCRQLPPVHRDHQKPGRHPQDPENRRPIPHLSAETPRRALTDETLPRYTPSRQSTASFRTSSFSLRTRPLHQLRNPGPELVPAAPPLYRSRISDIAPGPGRASRSPTRRRSYSQVNNTMPSSPDSNTMPCFRCTGHRLGALPIQDWFSRSS
jgi:hypothetical protein